MGGYIQIQSSNYGADYLESRINSFLINLKENGGFDSNKINNLKLSIVQELKQVNMNLLQETSDYWKAINNENYEFDSKKKLIRFIESVTPEEVN